MAPWRAQRAKGAQGKEKLLEKQSELRARTPVAFRRADGTLNLEPFTTTSLSKHLF